ncbi:MAG TPA: DUF2703 domain-containing protein [Terriglobia bacterium]|nr:DUF2703 domain-containing protein [Terriglobia bacterium]
MKVEVLYLAGCPNYLLAVDRLKAVLRQEGLAVEVGEIEVKDKAEAEALKFIGSPTIRVNGLDIEDGSTCVPQSGLGCRLYSGGLPAEEMIRKALRNAQGAVKRGRTYPEG